MLPTIEFNDFSENTVENAYDSGSNTYNNEDNQGNYWDDYGGVDENPEDDIGDIPYNIEGDGNQDQYVKGDFITQSQDPVAYIDSITQQSSPD